MVEKPRNIRRWLVVVRRRRRDRHDRFCRGHVVGRGDVRPRHRKRDIAFDLRGDRRYFINGYISIDKVNVVLPIYNGTYSAILRKGVGVLEDMDTLTGEKGSTTVLAGHRGGYNNKSTFKEIDSLDIEDTFIVDNKNADMKYKVIGKIVIEFDDCYSDRKSVV